MSPRFSAMLSDVIRTDPTMLVNPTPADHLRIASTLARWDTLEEFGLVRLTAEPDYDFDPNDFEHPEGFDDSNGDSLEAFGTIGQYRPTEDHDFVTGDSCWGHVGYKDVLDWRENPYILDIMAETIRNLVTSRRLHVRGLCPACGGTGRTRAKLEREVIPA